MSIEKEIKLLIDSNITCPCCCNVLNKRGHALTCKYCSKKYFRHENGVWDLRNDDVEIASPNIFKERKFLDWIKIFENTEIRNWSIYNSWFKRFFSQAGHRKIAKEIQPFISKNDTVLEIGAGNGTLLKFLNVKNYIGVDLSLKSLAMLKKYNPNAVVICLSGIKLPFNNTSKKAIVSLHTLEHIYFLAEHLQEVTRVLKSNGRYFYVIPTEGGLAFWLGRFIFTRRHLRKKYDMDVNYVMDREHINDAYRVLKFIKLHFHFYTKTFWPLKIRLLSINAMIYGFCIKK